jgi:hypothetical protein
MILCLSSSFFCRLFVAVYRPSAQRSTCMFSWSDCLFVLSFRRTPLFYTYENARGLNTRGQHRALKYLLGVHFILLSVFV